MIRMSENDKIVEVPLHPFSANMEKIDFELIMVCSETF